MVGGVPKRHIAVQLGLDVKTVRRYIGAAWTAGLRREVGPEALDEEADFRAVLAGLPAELCPVVKFAFLTGWRRSEIFGLQWRNVDFTTQTVRLEPGTTKNDEGRTFPFAVLPELGALLQQQREWTSAVEVELGAIIPWVFHRKARPIRDLRGAWEAACIAAGFFQIVNPAAPPAEQRKKATKLFHDFRRTAVRNLERAGVSRSVAMKLTGHKTEAVYRRYAIVAEADLSRGREEVGDTPGSHGEAREVDGEGTVVPHRDGAKNGQSSRGRVDAA